MPIKLRYSKGSGTVTIDADGFKKLLDFIQRQAGLKKNLKRALSKLAAKCAFKYQIGQVSISLSKPRKYLSKLKSRYRQEYIDAVKGAFPKLNEKYEEIWDDLCDSNVFDEASKLIINTYQKSDRRFPEQVVSLLFKTYSDGAGSSS